MPSFSIDLEPCPFAIQHQLNHEPGQPVADGAVIVPGYPGLASKTKLEVWQFLEDDLISPELELMAPYLWLMSKPDSHNVSPLHRQRVKGRRIVISEDPKLHLVWYYDKIFLKPLPQYLLSYQFWETYLDDNNQQLQQHKSRRLRQNALGLLRSYFLLIRYESDFHMAQDDEARLIPSKVTWTAFCHFKSKFDQIQDQHVSPRYSFGEIRLTRLNFYCKFILNRWQYQRMQAQYGPYFSQFYGPLFFVFGILSIALSAMEVQLTIEQLHTRPVWEGHVTASSNFSIACLLAMASVVAAFASLWLQKFIAEWLHALREHRR